LADLVLSETGDFLRDRNVGLDVVFVKSNKDGHWYLRRDLADVTALLKELHRIVNEAIRTQTVGDDQAEGLTMKAMVSHGLRTISPSSRLPKTSSRGISAVSRNPSIPKN
jgi:hypothetical protein